MLVCSRRTTAAFSMSLTVYRELSTAFAHIQSKALRRDNQFGEFWHANVLGGGIVVSQNEDDLFTCVSYWSPNSNDFHLASDTDAPYNSI